MNARRLAATETNIAYRTADHERWRDLDFVVGIRIVLSNNHTCLGSDGKPHKFEDICDKLSAEYGSTNTSGQGCYPKDFKFTGWHPHCRCHAESILKTDEEIAEDNRRILEGEEPIDYKQSEKYVKDVPKEFEEWVKANDERITKANSVPHFMSDNPKYTGITQKHGSVGAVTGTKLGRTATKYALKAYDGAPVAILTEDVIRNTSDIAQAMNLGKPKPMTFMDANQGRGNTLYGKDQSYSDNCQSAVVVHEARIRGLNVTSLGYDHNKSSVSYKLGERFEDIWENPKTHKTPSPTKIIDKSFDSMASKINSNTKSVGRYHIGVNFADGGHMITAERLSDGKLIFYEPQCGDFISIEEYANYSVKYFELLKVDKLLIKKDMFTAIARRF